MAWGGGGVEDGEGGGQRRRGGRSPVVAGWRGVVGAEAAVRAVEQTAGSVGVWGEQHVFRGVLARGAGAGVGDQQGRDDRGGERGGLRTSVEDVEGGRAGPRHSVHVHGGVEGSNALRFIGGGVDLLLVVHRGGGERDEVAGDNISERSVGLVGGGGGGGGGSIAGG